MFIGNLRTLLPSIKALFWILLSAAAFVAIVVIHKLFITETGLLEEGPPLFGPEYLLLSALIAFACFCFSVALAVWQPTRSASHSGHLVKGKVEWRLIWLALLISVVFVGIFLVSPSAFNSLSLEDGTVEWTSALLLFGCSIAFIRVFLYARKTPDSAKFLCGGALFMALIFFVTGMEEVSWMQRVIGLETSTAFQSNIQGEMNLHNFATEPVELAYYLGAFAFTVVLPFMRWQGIFPLHNRGVSWLIPRPWVLYVGVVACGYNFDMWNIFVIQATFWASCFFLLYILLRSPGNRALSGAVLLALVGSQTLFLAFDSHYARDWEVTEYKEFFMPLAFLAYSLDVLRQARAYVTEDKRRNGRVDAVTPSIRDTRIHDA